jgi:NADH-quinone oxidoreductase subunit G
MAKIVIDGKEYEAKPKQTIIQIADGINTGGKPNVDIPRFCYHEALSVAGNCRMCMVETGMPKVDPATKQVVLGEDGKPVINWIPKPATSCSTEIADGMHVRTHHTSQMVRDAQKGVLEFILINHPLDCPICDQAGECPLQQTTYTYGPEGSRFEFEKVHKPKRVEWNDHVLFDGERCINCTRCVRSFEEYTQTHDLSIVQRGWNNYPAPASGETVGSEYSMNVIDLCPVGALTSRDFRFKARVWEMSSTDTISVHDARSSNITLWVRDNLVLRITPRENPQVNGYFISDADRLDYKWLNDNRASVPRLKTGGQQKQTDWKAASAEAAKLLKQYKPSEIFVLASARACNESNYVLKKFATDVLKTPNIDFLRHVKGEDDHLLIRADKTPNAAGCELLGIGAEGGLSKDDLDEAIKVGNIKCLVVMEDDVVDFLPLETVVKLETLIMLPYNESATTKLATVVLPAATFAETIGTYINFQGVVQKTTPAKVLKHQNRETMMEMAKSRLDKHATQFDKWNNEANRVDAKPSWEIIEDIAQHFGKDFKATSANDIFKEMESKVAALKHLDYKKIGSHGVKIEKVSGGSLQNA